MRTKVMAALNISRALGLSLGQLQPALIGISGWRQVFWGFGGFFLIFSLVAFFF
jgi:hypothetical protein